VALASRGALATADQASDNLIDGVITNYAGPSGYAFGTFPCEFTVKLAKVYELQQIHMMLYDLDNRGYQYVISTSADGRSYQTLVDRSKGQWRSWQVIRFPPRPVQYIKINGLTNSANPRFHIVELEAYCTPPQETPKPKYPSDPG
jgi:hypothetical protein